VPWIAAISPVALLSRLMYRKSAPLGPITVGHRGVCALTNVHYGDEPALGHLSPPIPRRGQAKRP
jgi:hypothetical protein